MERERALNAARYALRVLLRPLGQETSMQRLWEEAQHWIIVRLPIEVVEVAYGEIFDRESSSQG